MAPRRKNRKRANPKNMKKTTRRGAYKPSRKRQMVIRRAPMVECKKDERYDWNGMTALDAGGPGATWANRLEFTDLQIGDTAGPSGGANHNISGVPDTWLYRSQGFKHNDMVGDSVFIKYLKMKFEIKLPVDANLIHFPQCQMYMIHGFVKKTIGANAYTDPTLATITRGQLVDIAAHQLDEYFNDSNEPLRYQPKGSINTTIKILGKKELRWNKNRSVLPDPVRESATVSWGTLPTKEVSIEWPMMRKQKYVEGGGLSNPDGTLGTRPANFFPNDIDPDHGIPFWCIYMPGGQNIVYSQALNRVQFRFNDVCYFTDS